MPENVRKSVDFPMLFIAEAGDAADPAAGVDGDVAPARRVMFPATDGTLSLVSADFAQLFLQAVEWAAGVFVETDIRLLEPSIRCRGRDI